MARALPLTELLSVAPQASVKPSGGLGCLRGIWLLLLVSPAPGADLANPPRVSYATYVGNPSGSQLEGLAVDQAGYSYVSGSESGCAFLTKLNQTGTAAVWSVCLPVTQINAVAVDPAGNIYAGTFVRDGPIALSNIMKLSPNAKQIIYSTSITGTDVRGLALDRAGNVYITGLANSTFQPTLGAYLKTPSGPLTEGSIFAAKLNVSGEVQYATYLDMIPAQYTNTSIAVDSMGQAWVAGAACPDGSGSLTVCNPSRDGTAAAIRKIDANGANLLVKKTFGGMQGIDHGYPFRDAAIGVAVDAADSAWIVGSAETGNVPTTPGAIQPKRPPGGFGLGFDVGYALKLSSSGDLLYGTYVGNNDGYGHSIASVAIDSEGRPHFALEVGFPISTRPLSAVMALSADGSTLLASRNFNSFVQAIALDGKGGLYVAGNTSSVAFLTTPGAYQTIYPGGPVCGYAAKFDLTTQSASTLTYVANAASLVPGSNPYEPEGAVAPGEIVSIFGTSFPPQPKVTFDGRPAPVLYADANQINAVVPFAVSAPSTIVAVEGASEEFTLPVRPAVPALFTANASGTGQLAALNQDGSVNSTANPAKVGSVVSVFTTGTGTLSPPLRDGETGPLTPPYPVPAFTVAAVMGTPTGVVAAPVLFAGQAPGLIAGVVQVNVQIPDGTKIGDAGLILYFGNYQTQLALTTIAVR